LVVASVSFLKFSSPRYFHRTAGGQASRGDICLCEQQEPNQHGSSSEQFPINYLCMLILHSRLLPLIGFHYPRINVSCLTTRRPRVPSTNHALQCQSSSLPIKSR
jgi:hypothetical protein